MKILWRTWVYDGDLRGPIESGAEPHAGFTQVLEVVRHEPGGTLRVDGFLGRAARPFEDGAVRPWRQCMFGVSAPLRERIPLLLG